MDSSPQNNPMGLGLTYLEAASIPTSKSTSEIKETN